MKKILFILLVIFTACKSEQDINPPAKQEIASVSKYKKPNYKKLKEFQGDTLRYLEANFLGSQNFYKDKPLEVLLNDLELDIKAYSNSYGSNLNLSSGLSINFYSQSEKRKKIKDKKNPLVLTIVWENPLLQEKIVELLRKNNGRWTKEENQYYGQYYVKEIGMVVPNY